MPGPRDTFIAYGKSWANVSNTPFREYKHFVHEGRHRHAADRPLARRHHAQRTSWKSSRGT